MLQEEEQKMEEVHLQEVEGHRDQVEAGTDLAFDRNQGIDVAVALPDVGLPDVDLPEAAVCIVHNLLNTFCIRKMFVLMKCE